MLVVFTLESSAYLSPTPTPTRTFCFCVHIFLPVPQTEYQVEIEIDTLNTAALTLLKDTLKKLSLPLINSKINITEITITTGK